MLLAASLLAREARLLRLDPGGLGDLGEPGDFAFYMCGELLGRTWRDFQSLGAERGLHIRPAQDLDGFGVEAPDDRAPSYPAARLRVVRAERVAGVRE
jgi:hypothetical protein